MKNLTLYTQAYEQLLKDFLVNGSTLDLKFHSEGRNETLFYVGCAYEQLAYKTAEALACLLEQVAIQENPVYRYSEKLARLALDLRRTPLHEENIHQLSQYLEENRSLHLEGYVFFRMTEYRHKLDMMMFLLIKKLKLPE